MYNKVLVVNQKVVVTGSYNAENIITLYDEAIERQDGSILRCPFQSTGRLCYRHYQCLFQYIGIKNVQVNGGLDRFRFLIFSLFPETDSLGPIEGWLVV